jgi:hypothetical protein
MIRPFRIVHRKFKIGASKFFLQLKNGFMANMLYDGPPCMPKLNACGFHKWSEDPRVLIF